MASKADLIEHIANTNDLTKSQAAAIVDSVTDYITDVLGNGDKLSLTGFGTFSVSERGERQGRNPATGESITIAASKSARFKPGKALKDALNG